MQIKNKPHKPYLQVNQLVQVVLESPTYERKHKKKLYMYIRIFREKTIIIDALRY